MISDLMTDKQRQDYVRQSVRGVLEDGKLRTAKQISLITGIREGSVRYALKDLDALRQKVVVDGATQRALYFGLNVGQLLQKWKPVAHFPWLDAQLKRKSGARA